MKFSTFVAEVGSLYNWILVNHYPLVSSSGALRNQILLIDLHEWSQRILVLPEQEKLLKFLHFGDESGYDREKEEITVIKAVGFLLPSTLSRMASAVRQGSLRSII